VTDTDYLYQFPTVAERANRTMADDISAMLYESQLPPSLWGNALNAQIHVWNLLPTSTLKGMTPHEAWFKHCCTQVCFLIKLESDCLFRSLAVYILVAIPS
jgi:hypothetical protein